jgi:hypothetical protein
MWYALEMDAGIIATAPTKKQLINEIWDMVHGTKKTVLKLNGEMKIMLPELGKL